MFCQHLVGRYGRGLPIWVWLNSDPSGMDSLSWGMIFPVWKGRSHRNCGETPRRTPAPATFFLQVQEITWKWLNSYFSWWGLGGQKNVRESNGGWQGVVDTTWKGWRMRFNRTMAMVSEVLDRQGGWTIIPQVDWIMVEIQNIGNFRGMRDP